LKIDKFLSNKKILNMRRTTTEKDGAPKGRARKEKKGRTKGKGKKQTDARNLSKTGIPPEFNQVLTNKNRVIRKKRG